MGLNSPDITVTAAPYLSFTMAERREPKQRIVDLLGQLRTPVVAHVDDVAPGGAICGMASASGGDVLVRECRERCQDHTHFAEELARIEKPAVDGSVQPEWWDELEARFHALVIYVANSEDRKQIIVNESDNQD